MSLNAPKHPYLALNKPIFFISIPKHHGNSITIPKQPCTSQNKTWLIYLDVAKINWLTCMDEITLLRSSVRDTWMRSPGGDHGSLWVLHRLAREVVCSGMLHLWKRANANYAKGKLKFRCVGVVCYTHLTMALPSADPTHWHWILSPNRQNPTAESCLPFCQLACQPDRDHYTWRTDANPQHIPPISAATTTFINRF